MIFRRLSQERAVARSRGGAARTRRAGCKQSQCTAQWLHAGDRWRQAVGDGGDRARDRVGSTLALLASSRWRLHGICMETGCLVAEGQRGRQLRAMATPARGQPAANMKHCRNRALCDAVRQDRSGREANGRAPLQLQEQQARHRRGGRRTGRAKEETRLASSWWVWRAGANATERDRRGECQLRRTGALRLDMQTRGAGRCTRTADERVVAGMALPIVKSPTQTSTTRDTKSQSAASTTKASTSAATTTAASAQHSPAQFEVRSSVDYGLHRVSIDHSMHSPGSPTSPHTISAPPEYQFYGATSPISIPSPTTPMGFSVPGFGEHMDPFHPHASKLRRAHLHGGGSSKGFTPPSPSRTRTMGSRRLAPPSARTATATSLLLASIPTPPPTSSLLPISPCRAITRSPSRIMLARAR